MDGRWMDEFKKQVETRGFFDEPRLILTAVDQEVAWQANNILSCLPPNPISMFMSNTKN